MHNNGYQLQNCVLFAVLLAPIVIAALLGAMQTLISNLLSGIGSVCSSELPHLTLEASKALSVAIAGCFILTFSP